MELSITAHWNLGPVVHQSTLALKRRELSGTQAQALISCLCLCVGAGCGVGIPWVAGTSRTWALDTGQCCCVCSSSGTRRWDRERAHQGGRMTPKRMRKNKPYLSRLRTLTCILSFPLIIISYAFVCWRNILLPQKFCKNGGMTFLG